MEELHLAKCSCRIAVLWFCRNTRLACFQNSLLFEESNTRGPTWLCDSSGWPFLLHQAGTNGPKLGQEMAVEVLLRQACFPSLPLCSSTETAWPRPHGASEGVSPPAAAEQTDPSPFRPGSSGGFSWIRGLFFQAHVSGV